MTETRNNRVDVRLTKEEKLNIEEKAKLSELTISEFMRQCALTASVKINIIHEPNINQLTDLVYQLRKIGVNINEIAHKLNADQAFDSTTREALLSSLAAEKELIAICRQLVEASYGNS